MRSSTGDVFLNGVANAPWLPLVLAGLSLAGVFVGIMLRVRSFVYLGSAFLVLALFTMIWYAAVDLEQTWLWYVCGSSPECWSSPCSPSSRRSVKKSRQPSRSSIVGRVDRR